MSEMPQRRLAYEMRIAIDRAIRLPRFEKAVLRLVDLSPHNSASSHVRHNLGVARRAWVDALLSRSEATRSLRKETGWSARIGTHPSP